MKKFKLTWDERVTDHEDDFLYMEEKSLISAEEAKSAWADGKEILCKYADTAFFELLPHHPLSMFDDSELVWCLKPSNSEGKQVELIYCPTDEDSFDDLQDALEFIRDVASDLDDAVGWGIDVCEKIPFNHSYFVSASDFVNDMQNRAYEEGREYADDYLNDVEYDKEKLADLDKLISDWFNKNSEQPRFYQAGKTVNSIIVDQKLLEEHGIRWE